MKASRLLIVFGLAISNALYADDSTIAARDKALKGVEACSRRNEVSSRECKNLFKDIQTLEDVYRQGDKTVLSTLLHFSYLTAFLGEALNPDPEAFLTVVSQMSEQDQITAAYGIAGGSFGLKRLQFDAIRNTLRKVPNSSSNYQVAIRYLRMLESQNASLLIDYFPPQTFAGRAGDFRVHWFSSELYSLDQKPMWPPASESERSYRITILPSFSLPETVTLAVLPDNTGRISFHTLDPKHLNLNPDSSRSLTPEQIADFGAVLDRTKFWQMLTEPPQTQTIGLDGTQWILEGVQDGKYRLVIRWCPGRTPFAELGRKLFDLAGHKLNGGC